MTFFRTFTTSATIIILFPVIQCSTLNLNTIVENGTFFQETQFTVNETTERLIVFSTANVTWPFIVTTRTTNATLKSPVLVVVQEQLRVLSWSLPFQINSSDPVGFSVVSRTLCDDNLTQPIDNHTIYFKEKFTIVLSTYSSENVSIFLTVNETTHFHIEKNVSYVTNVAESEPQYFFYRVSENDPSTLIVNITSDDPTCFIASVQKKKCPVHDLQFDVTYEGSYQTIDNKGALRIETSQYSKGFFLVFVVNTDNEACKRRHALPENNKLIHSNDRHTVVNFIILDGTSNSNYIRAPLIIVGLLLIFVFVAILMVYIFTLYRKRQNFQYQANNNGNKNENLTQGENENLNENENLIKGENENLNENENLIPGENENVRRTSRVANLSLNDADINKKISFSYLWHVLSIGVFYSIPVVQLVFTYERIMNNTGNEDICYYNFLCANPVWIFSSFNQVFSNLGYIVMGFLFLGVVYKREHSDSYNTEQSTTHYGIFYAMGAALIYEGILSGCYHICPSQAAFQFDTTFMYIMAVLCIVKLYQNRHSDIVPCSYATFALVGFIVFVAMVGILIDSDSKGQKQIFWIIVILIYIPIYVLISFKVYYRGKVLDGLRNFWNSLQENGISKTSFTPHNTQRFISLVIANVVNYSFLISALWLCLHSITDFGTCVLGLLMLNAILYCLIYIYMKVRMSENLPLEACIYSLLAVLSWSSALYFFAHSSTSWTVSPAKSRHWNQPCVFLNFYDNHDVWHLTSACALYFTFMFILCLDDNVLMNRN